MISIQAGLLRERKLRVMKAQPTLNRFKFDRKLSRVSDLLSADDVEEMAAKSRISDFDARQMAVNASQKQQRLAHLLNLVNNFKTAMEDVTNSLNGQISQINGLLAQVKD